MAEPTDGTKIHFNSACLDMQDLTPSDSTMLSPMPRGFFVKGTSGDVTVVTAGGTTITLPALPLYATVSCVISKVMATGTDAVDIVGMY